MKKMKYIFCLALGMLALTSCSDADSEITSVDYARNFSPIGLEAKVRNNTNVLLDWTVQPEAEQYTIEVYENDVLEFKGNPIKTLTITPEEVPYMVTGLMGETDYSFRVKSARADGSKESKWSVATVQTGKEQIFYAVADEDIKGKEVTLRWPAGEEAATITLTPGDIEYNITSADIAAGAATITGLTPETDYTAVMKRSNGLTRGTIKFTTSIDLADNDILVKTGSSIVDAVADAPEGYRLIVEPGIYNIPAEEAEFGGSLKITKKIAIKGLRQNDLPVFKGRVEISAELDIDQVAFDGTGTDGGQCFNFVAEGALDHFSVSNSEISNYVKGFYYINKAVKVNTITIDNCLISNITCDGGDMFDCRAGAIVNLNIKNNTIWNSCAERDMVRYDDKSGDFADVSPVITIDHNTIVGVCNNAGKRILYVRFKNNSITFTNNIVTNSIGNFSNQSSTAVPTFGNNLYFEADGYCVSGANANAKFIDESGTVIDPKFKDAANGDFTITNDDAKDKKSGAPRWY